MKLSLRINLLFVMIVTGLLLVISVVIYNSSRRNTRLDFQKRLENRAARTAYLFRYFRNDTTNMLQELDENAPPQLFNKSIYVVGKSKEILYEYHDKGADLFQPDPSRLDNAKDGKPVFYKSGGQMVCIYNDRPAADDFTVVVAAENITGREYLENLRQVFFVFFPAAVLFTLVAGFLFSRSIVRPIKETIRDARLITSQNLSTRLYVGRRRDELAELNATFNDLLNRLEEAFDIQRRFISNASHELSTPLTSVSSQIEVALLQNRPGEEYRRVLQSVLEDVKDLHQLTKTLLEIANAGTHGAISLDKIRLDEVLVRAHGDVLKQNPGYKIGLRFADLPEDENECLVFGNIHLLYSAFKNIMENGCKYSPDSAVEVQLNFRGAEAELVFINKSDTLSAEEITRIFEPFYRSRNAEGKPGVGLGLTLTRRIIGIHKGTLRMESDQERGTIFTITLPTLHK